MKKGRLILIVGTSGAGKSVLANEIIRKGAILNGEESMPSNCIQGDEDYYDELAKISSNRDNTFFFAKKYLTREPRSEDVGIAHSTKAEMDSVCDVVMPQYKEGDYVGFNVEEIISQIDKGKCPIIVTGIMGAIQEIIKAFYERKRLDDIYLVGIRGFLMDMDKYIKLEKGRYRGRVMESSTIESAQKRCHTSRKFARIIGDFSSMFDYEFDNYRLKYFREPDLAEEAINICTFAQYPSLDRSEEQTRSLMEFISCNLNELEPVREDEIRNTFYRQF